MIKSKVLREIFIVVACLLSGFVISKYILTNIRGSEYNRASYNCELAEISPDFPKEVKQKCRELKHENRSMQ